MYWLDLTFPDPAHNLACDEALLEWSEAEAGVEILRFWEAPQPFVVLGYTNKAAVETNEATCETQGVPVLRRCSGGGTVLQGPGSFNYSLILSIESRPELASVTSANSSIIHRLCDAVSTLLETPATVHGYTDLTLKGRKFSGNAQRRKQKFLLFHGTLLLDFDLSLIEQLLQMPPVKPEYREGRSHLDFLTNLHLSRSALREALSQEWDATGPLPTLPIERINSLSATKYENDEWNRKF